MTNPVLVEVTRGNLVESRHRGVIAVVDGEGKVVYSLGEIDQLVFPRSACKAMQALPLLESGAADAYGFGNKELALSASSHSGEPEHAALAASMLAAAGRSEADLECGAHWSFEQKVAIQQARSMDHPNQLHNNCSGKHAGFICAACHTGMEVKDYVTYDHPLQGEIRGAMESLTGAVLGHDVCGTDGCSIPTYAVPLRSLAHGFAKMVTGEDLEPIRAKSARRILDACMAEPFYVAGTKRACTELMRIAPGRIFAKTGAEGVFCAAVPEMGVAIALKCEDGATRAAEAMVAGVLSKLFSQDAEVKTRLDAMASYTMRNWNGGEVGKVRYAPAF
jgi:L-asparaginase II